MATAVQSYSPRITGAELPRNGSPIIISSYRVDDVNRANRDYRINLEGMDNPFKQVNWVRQNGTITPEMMNLLVPRDAVKPLKADNTYVWTNSNPELYEGLRALIWGFGGRERPDLDSGREPEYGYSDRGSVLGSVAEGEGRIKIPGIGYFVQPEVALRGEDLWETQLYVQKNGLVNSDEQDVNRIAAFVQPEEPSKQWMGDEVKRFESGEGLKEKQVRDAYRGLRDGIWKSCWVRSSGILAWPTMPSREAEDFVNVRVPRTQYERLQELAKRAGVPITEI
ncbi:MAG: hypothetical protein HYW23_02420 [Candidatus Aenigmarchaeota archaeon]|nr:hypothetical protein [Candidatus Aenigmarchaeota archaeon]